MQCWKVREYSYSETKMSLEKWVEYGWLRAEPTSPGEIKNLWGIVDRGLADSHVEAISDDLRFIAALGAALTVARLRFALQATVRQPKQATTLRRLNLWN